MQCKFVICRPLLQGEKELSVTADLIRPLDPAPGSPSRLSGAVGGLREGARVEARFRGKLRYYPGVIRKENRDGSFDIDYDDVRRIAITLL